MHRLHRGEVVKSGPLGWLQRLRSPNLHVQLFLLSVWAAAAPVLSAFFDAPLPVTVGAALLSIGSASFLCSRVALKPLSDLVSMANLIASGDLTHSVTVNGRGEIRQLQLALAQLVVSVRTVVRDVRHEVANLRGATQEIAAGNQDMSVRTESQAANLEQTASSMEEINGTTQHTSQLSQDGAQVARETSGAARRSNEAVVAVADTMQGIADSSKRIGDIIQVIEGVAFQTNILALNAAVEAARAGEQGRGFAVVAAEVRALAQRTSAASREIRDLIEESGQRVEVGAQRTADARMRMDEAMHSVERVSSVLEEISHATQEQTTGVSRVSAALMDMDGITQQNAAMVEELAAAAKSLNHQVEQVHDSIRVFRLTDRDITLAETDAVELRRAGKKASPGADGSVDPEEVMREHQKCVVDLRKRHPAQAADGRERHAAGRLLPPRPVAVGWRRALWTRAGVPRTGAPAQGAARRPRPRGRERQPGTLPRGARHARTRPEAAAQLARDDGRAQGPAGAVRAGGRNRAGGLLIPAPVAGSAVRQTRRPFLPCAPTPHPGGAGCRRSSFPAGSAS